jgi:hypothetical protein
MCMWTSVEYVIVVTIIGLCGLNVFEIFTEGILMTSSRISTVGLVLVKFGFQTVAWSPNLFLCIYKSSEVHIRTENLRANALNDCGTRRPTFPNLLRNVTIHLQRVYSGLAVETLKWRGTQSLTDVRVSRITYPELPRNRQWRSVIKTTKDISLYQ